jgi:hypothetical protein
MDINEVIREIEKDIDKLPRNTDYDKGFVAGSIQTLFIIKMVMGRDEAGDE